MRFRRLHGKTLTVRARNADGIAFALHPKRGMTVLDIRHDDWNRYNGKKIE
jgi:hypothetical protein